MAEDDRFLQLRTTQIEEPVLQPDFLVGDFGRTGQERRRLRLVEDRQLRDDQFDLAGEQFRIDQFLPTRDDFALYLDDVFVAQRAGRGEHFCAIVGVDDDLRQAVTITQINEHQSAVVSSRIHPTA